MSEATTTAVNSAKKAVAAVAETLPTVVGTEEITATLEVPTKVVLNQGLIVAASFVGGIAVTAGAVFGYKKFQEYKLRKDLAKVSKDETEPLKVTKIGE